jgi:hypothetical protein
VGQPFAHLDIGLPLEPLLGPIRACLGAAISTRWCSTPPTAAGRRSGATSAAAPCSPTRGPPEGPAAHARPQVPGGEARLLARRPSGRGMKRRKPHALTGSSGR